MTTEIIDFDCQTRIQAIETALNKLSSGGHLKSGTPEGFRWESAAEIVSQARDNLESLKVSLISYLSNQERLQADVEFLRQRTLGRVGSKIPALLRAPESTAVELAVGHVWTNTCSCVSCNKAFGPVETRFEGQSQLDD